MKNNTSTSDLLHELIRLQGAKKARRLLEDLVTDSDESPLTIIANKTFHEIPTRYLRGHVYVASEGNLNLSSAREAKAVYRDILARLTKLLTARTWKEIYLIPTGHPTLSAAIKLAVYQVTRRNTVDLFYANGKYFDLNISVRDVASKAASVR